MAYSINPNLPKARALALKLLINEGLPLQVLFNKYGVQNLNNLRKYVYTVIDLYTTNNLCRDI